jgi:hypothetical protein
MLCNVRSKFHERDRGDESRYAGGGDRTRTELPLQGILGCAGLPVTLCNHWVSRTTDAKLCKFLCE